MKKPKRFIRFMAWWYRNIKYRDRVVEFYADRIYYELFDLVNLYNGIEAYYLGQHKFLPKERNRPFTEDFSCNIPQIAL